MTANQVFWRRLFLFCNLAIGSMIIGALQILSWDPEQECVEEELRGTFVVSCNILY